MSAQDCSRYVALGIVLAALLAACASEEFPSSGGATSAGADGGDADAAGPTGPKVCTQTRGEPLPARLTAMSAHASEGAQVLLVSDLYDQFVSNCGKCHGALNAMGSFQMATATDFTLKYIQDQNVVSHIESNLGCPFSTDATNKQEPMPPCGEPNAKPFSQRTPNDPVFVFAKLLEQWVAMGGPQSFTPASTGSTSRGDAGAPVSQFTMTPGNGNAMTNIGNCVPTKALVAVEETKSAALDKLFERATSKPGGSAAEYIGLPEKLSETDLFTLDSQTLAQYGVIAYAPAYPLWSDDAGKLRHVRVPRGTSIHFNKDTQSFDIPRNTRFYKTFMKLIADTDGSYRYHKIETRLIVARPDTNNPDGTAAAQTALFGTYIWNADESEATLLENLLYDGEPFPDQILSYNTDEQLAASILAANPLLPEEQLLEKHALRHYAVPSSTRCIQCHMGSPSQDFVLGFNPLQINRRSTGTGGTIPDHGVDAGADELMQLQRFIDYGLITGIDAPSDVLPLEQSQGARAPRNDYELRAQGYLLGNCAHCHNPRGYPTSIQPLLTDTLNFLPSATGGGIFQFPLERFSPDIFRGASGTTHIPFITPSLMDHPRTDVTGQPVPDPFFKDAALTSADTAAGFDYSITYATFAPWRSLIYRNVASAFTYQDDLTLYPHMPMNTPGYDPRAKQVLSDWMVSIPAVRKNPEIAEYAFHGATVIQGGAAVDTNEQPYVEVLPGDPRYVGAQAAANLRVDILEGKTQNPATPPPTLHYVPYQDPANTSDILDPNVELNPTCHQTPSVGVASTDANPINLPLPFIEHPHWVTTDLTQLLGYTPRRSDWAKYLVSLATPPQPPGCALANEQTAAYNDQLDAIKLVQTYGLDPTFTAFAMKPRPMGIWQPKSGCTYPAQKPVSAYTAMPADTEGLGWLRNAENVPSPTAPVYEETPGAEVFKMICINCHGKLADSNGFIAQNLALLTGGLARVADFRDGFLGPTSSPGLNRSAAFGTAALPAGAGSNWTGVTDDDRAARYMAWMALGGTEVIIPPSVLAIVGTTPVLGVPQQVGTQSANMLAVAKDRCASLFGSTPNTLILGQGSYLDQKLDPSLISKNGDGELWLRMCSLENPSPVHVIGWNSSSPQDAQNYGSGRGISFGGLVHGSGFLSAEFYAAHASTVGDENFHIVSISPGPPGGAPVGWPEWPFCISVSDDDAVASPPPPGWPICPKAVRDAVVPCRTGAPGATGCFSEADANLWAVHGAMNAGFSVYLYLKSLETLAKAPPDYTQCEQLQ